MILILNGPKISIFVFERLYTPTVEKLLILKTFSGFDLTCQRLSVSFPNKKSQETYLNCCPPWLGDKENFSF